MGLISQNWPASFNKILISGKALGESQITLAEVRHAVLEEMAQTVTDFFTRRASIFYWQADGGLKIANQVADEMGRLLNWDEQESQRQIASYSDWVAMNRFSPLDV